MVLKLEGITKSYKNLKVLHGIDLTIDKGQLVSIIGPSGAGKTTLLKIIAGLEKADSGNVINTTGHRAILVFQDYLLFPMMNVYENIAFGLKAARIDKSAISKRVKSILDSFSLLDKIRAYPAELSAGQKQRACIARAMVLEPEMLLLDEPFANLDKNLKLEMAEFIRSKQQEYGTAALLVTHDQQEAFMISDRIGIMIDGRLIQYGTAGNIYGRPVSIEAASFLGHVNIIPEKLRQSMFQGVLLDGGKAYARAESFRIEKDPAGNAVVMAVVFTGRFIIYRVLIEDWICTVYRLEGGIETGDKVRISIIA
ncbi:MAG: ABC transporter ATP-binding protein [Brevinematales bacterium]|jgi:putative spermidine/putrescine transport system ATP-binding protein